jgi:acetyl esterase/lipase
MKAIYLSVLLFIAAVAAPGDALGQTRSSDWATQIGSRYWVQPDIVYGSANNTALKLDVWYRHQDKEPQPTLVYFHGGGWIFGAKTYSLLHFLPFLEKGWRVVDVEYRMASNSHAPAAVEDTRCALRWVFRNAAQWKFDTTKIVLTGHSAGGHLALMTGMLPAGNPLDNACHGEEELSVAAIINWYGITDVNDLIAGPNLKNYAVMWMGSQKNPDAIAKGVSPLTYVREGLPPIFTVHGNKDDVVPYSHATRLHAALNESNVTNRLHTVPGGGHGMFADAEFVRAYDQIWAFLKEQGVSER